MTSPKFVQDFSLNPAHKWLNVASEGPMPNCAVRALEEAVEWKKDPHLLTIPKFQQTPMALKKSLAQLLHANNQDIILGNSATYGLHLLSNGLSFKKGDEVLLLENDFPSDILPWLSLTKKGVLIHQLNAQNHVLTPKEIKSAINQHTRLICLPYIHSFSGHKEDILSIGQLCRDQGILFVVNISQAAGCIPINLKEWQVDAVVGAGYKWLLGPYGTGYCWIKKELREQLDYPQNYWISLIDESSLNSIGPISLKDDHSSRRYDVFGTANFFNFVPWAASINYLTQIGIEIIEKHNQTLVDQLADGLKEDGLRIISPFAKKDRTNIVVFEYKDSAKNSHLFDYLKSQGFHLAFWKNHLRASPHIYNTPNDIKGLLNAIHTYEHK